MSKRKWAVIAIGGNSLIKDKDHQTVEEQYRAAGETARHIARMIAAGWNVTVAHGNGPQVGFILRRSEIAAKAAGMHEVPMDVCGADSQGAIGYALQQNLHNELAHLGISKSVATIVTQVLVDRDDPSFRNPSKPIGGFMDEAEARKRQSEDGWSVVEDAGRGWRRVVPSPIPRKIVELEVIQAMMHAGIVVISTGGGGIPVVENEAGDYSGIAAVIDKDHASALLASEIKADLFLISTAVEKVYLNYRKPDQRGLDVLTVAEARELIAHDQFAKGSMLPKIQACIHFLEAGGKTALITDPEHIMDALDGRTGTRLMRG